MIIVIGDSWGVGEWDSPGTLNGPGFGQYLMLHDQVINLSVGAGSNTNSLDRLQHLLTRFQLSADDRLFWIITCPSRCANMQYFLSSDRGIWQTARDLLHASFDRAQGICDREHIEIDLIGGLCDLCDVDLAKWPNLRLSVPSWCRLIDPHSPICAIDPIWWSDLGQEIHAQRTDLIEEWLYLSQQIIDKSRAMSKMFSTDGCHPDRHAHKILRDYFYPEWSHKH